MLAFGRAVSIDGIHSSLAGWYFHSCTLKYVSLTQWQSLWFIHIYIYVCMYVCIYICIYIYVYICVSIYMYISFHTYSDLWWFIYLFILFIAPKMDHAPSWLIRNRWAVLHSWSTGSPVSDVLCSPIELERKWLRWFLWRMWRLWRLQW